MGENMIICPKCGVKNENTAVECRNCGIVFERYKKLSSELLETAITAFNRNELNSAQKLFEKVASNYPEMAEASNVYIKKIHEIIRDDAFEKALHAYKEDELTTAKKLFEKIASEYSEMAVEANMYIKNIYEKTRDKLFKKALSAFEGDVYEFADSLFHKLASEYPEKAEEANSYLEKIREKRRMWPIAFLRVIAWVNLFAGVISCILIPVIMNTELRRTIYGSYANAVGIYLGLVAMIGGIIAWIFLLVVCLMAEKVIEIANNTTKSN